MAKMRVYELAKMLDADAKDVLRELQTRGEPVRSVSSSVPPRLVRELVTDSRFTWRPEILTTVRSRLADAQVRRPRPLRFSALESAPAFWVEGELAGTRTPLVEEEIPTRHGVAALSDPAAGPYRVLSWAAREDGFVLAGWQSLTRLPAEEQQVRITAAGLQAPAGAHPQPSPRTLVPSWPWIPVAVAVVRTGGTLRSDGQTPELQGLVAQLGAVWQALEASGGSTPGRGRGESVPGALGDAEPVHLVRVRSAGMDEDHESGGAEGQPREYRHRWSVRGHWRQQPYGPGRSQRRRVWIDAHTKGPEDAPMVGDEVVYVLAGSPPARSSTGSAAQPGPLATVEVPARP